MKAPSATARAQARLRPLLMDAYLPVGDAPPEGRPTLVLSHGGAFHRGAKDNDEFEQGGSHNTPVHEYCVRFAARGYACFSIGYRLTQERPAPLPRPVKRNRKDVERDRIDFVRGLLGLPPASNEELLLGVGGRLWADVASAFGFIRAHAARWGVDPDRMAIGGFSAGGFASSYAVYAMGAARSGGDRLCPAAWILADAEYYVHGGRGHAAGAAVRGRARPAVDTRRAWRALAACAARAGLGLRHYGVPGKPHFYDRDVGGGAEAGHAAGRRALRHGGRRDRAVPARRCWRRPAVTVDSARGLRPGLEPPRHRRADVVHGRRLRVPRLDRARRRRRPRHIGREAVRTAFQKAWADFPDAQWTRARHVVTGARGLSEWTFVGTRASDGQRVEVDGCDLFGFQGDKIRVKDSWRKLRT